MASICLPTYLQNISYTRVPILNIVMFFWDGTVRLFEASLADSRQDDYFSTDFLPAMASDHSSMTNKLELLKNRWVHKLLAMCSIDWARARTYWQWAGPKIFTLLSAHHLIGTYFLTTESDKHMHLLTGLYGIHVVPNSIFLKFWLGYRIFLLLGAFRL